MVVTRSGTFYEFSDDEEENELDTPSKKSMASASTSVASEASDVSAVSGKQDVSLLSTTSASTPSSTSASSSSLTASFTSSIAPKVRSTSSSFFSVTSRLVRPFKSSSTPASVEVAVAGDTSSDEDDSADSGVASASTSASASAAAASSTASVSTTSSFSSSSSSFSTSFVKPRAPTASALTSTTSTAATEVVEEPIIPVHLTSTPSGFLSGFLHPPTPPPTPSTASSSSTTSSSTTSSSLSSIMRTSLTGGTLPSASAGTTAASVSISSATSAGASSEVGGDRDSGEYEFSFISPVAARPAIHALGGARIRDPPLKTSAYTSSYSSSSTRSALRSRAETQPLASAPPPAPLRTISSSSSTSTVILKQPVLASASSAHTSVAPKTPATHSSISSSTSSSYISSLSDARRLNEGPRPRQAVSAYGYLISSVAAKSSEEPSEEMSLTVDGLDVTTLNDDELFEKLKGLGVAVGPIVASTRSIYQRKLAALLRGGDTIDAPTTNGDLDASDAYSDSDAEAEEEAKAETASRVSSHLSHVSSRATTSSRPPSTTSTPSASRTGASDLRRRVLTSGGKSEVVETSPTTSILESEVIYDPERHTPSPRRSLRTVTSTVTSNETITYRKFLNNGKSYVAPPVETTVEEVEKPTPAPSKLWMLLRLLVKLLFFLLIIAIIYIVYENMSTESPFAALEHAARKALESAIGDEPEGEGASPPPVGEDSGAETAEVPA